MTEVRGIVLDIWHNAMTLVAAESDANTTQQAEGKLLRPALCLLTAGALGRKDLSSLGRLAAAYELMHIASLTHDDVVDHASLRRGQESLNTLWDNHAAILGGDYLVARALELLTEYDSSALISGALQAMRRMAEGELRYYGRNPVDQDEEDCIALASSKTASLFAAACSAPALLFATGHTQAIYDFGIGLGIAFQLLDDLLDITQPASVLGKPACGDVTEGKHTLPLHLLRLAMSPKDRNRFERFVGHTLTEAEQAWVRDTVAEQEIDKTTRARAEHYIDQAIHAIDGLPDSEFKESMTALARFVLIRQA